LNRLSDKEIEAYNSDPNNTDKIVCKNEAYIDSRIPKRACRLQSSIDERTRQDQRNIEEIQAGATHTINLTEIGVRPTKLTKLEIYNRGFGKRMMILGNSDI
jgi:hypothetical protein